MRYTITKHCQKRTPVYQGFDEKNNPAFLRWDGNPLFHTHPCIGEASRKKDAINIADDCPHKAQVYDTVLSTIVYDNGREPELLSSEEYRKAGGV